MTDFPPPQTPPHTGQPAPAQAHPTSSYDPDELYEPSAFEAAPAPPVAPTRRTRDRRGGRFIVGAALGALVGSVVSGGIVAVTARADDHPAAVAAPAVATPVTVAHNSIAALVDKAEPSIVSIHDSITQTDQFGQTQSGQAAGSGFVLSADGYIVTNNHVIDGATDITVNFHDGSTATASVVAADPHSDLAVLKVDRTDLAPLPMGDSSQLEVGDQLVAIGNALDLSGGPTVTTGIVSATGRSLTEENGVTLSDMIQTDTAINPGNSGGPLLDMAGEVVGINTAVAGQAQNIGFAISIDHTKPLIAQLRNGTVPAHAMLGVGTQPSTDGNGVTIASVDPGSGAADAGLQAGDEITKVDNTTIDSPETLAATIVGHQPNDKITVTYVRNGSTRHVEVTLGTRPSGS
jgi:S1-C subfamily serine protease